MSATQILAIAARTGQRIYSIIQDNVNSVLPLLGVDNTVKQDIENAVANGMLAFVPEREIAHKGYNGVGYIILEPETGAAGYLISGGRNGLSQTDCVAGVNPPVAEISVNTIMNWDTLGPALVGATSFGAATPEKQESLKALKEFGEQMVKPLAQKIAGSLSPAILQSMASPSFNSAVGVGIAVDISVKILLLLIAFKVFLQESGIQTKARTDEDVCECKKNPDSPNCPCKKEPGPHKPPLMPNINTPYSRRVAFHNMCADASGKSYLGRDVEVTSPGGARASFDLFNNQSNTACEVKTSFRKTPYEPFMLLVWRVQVRKQLKNQINVAKACKFNYCLIVNQPWLLAELRPLVDGNYSVYLNPTCRSPVDDPSELPIPVLD